MMQDIHDITPPIQVGIDPAIIKYILAGIAVIIILAAIYFAIRYILKKKKHSKSDTLLLPPPLPPDEAAIKELNLLENLMGKNPRLFCFRLSSVFRTYLGKQFKINAPEMTTEELVMHLKHLDIDKNIRSKAKEFLLSLDDIKYAGITPPAEKMKHDYNFVKNFVKSISQKNSENNNESV